jgi:hypothetical protein
MFSAEAIIDTRRQVHSLRPSGEYLLRQPLHLRWVPVQSPAFGSLELPLIAIISIAGRGKKMTCTQDRYKAKLERLCLARLTYCDQAITL